MYGCGEQAVGVASGSGWNLWVWLLGVVLRRYIYFLILLISCICTFLQQHPYFLFMFIYEYKNTPMRVVVIADCILYTP